MFFFFYFLFFFFESPETPAFQADKSFISRGFNKGLVFFYFNGGVISFALGCNFLFPMAPA